MNLYSTTTKFATEVCVDPYGVGTSFNAALRKFSDSTNSGPASRRRVLVTEPTVTMFSTRVVQIGGVDYVVGGTNKDQWKGETIRIKYPLLPAELTFQVGTVGQILAGTLPSRLVYMSPDYVRGTVADAESSTMHSNFTVSFSSYETVSRGNILKQGSKYYRVKNDPHLDGAEFQEAEVLLLTSPLQTLSFVKKTGYNPATDTIVNGTTTSISAFVEDAYLVYDHTTPRHEQLKPGDKNITINPVSAPTAGDTIGIYQILTIDPVSGGYSCHCRRV